MSRIRRVSLRALLVMAVLAGTLLPATAAFAAYSDVPSSYWDYTAITYVATTHPWMQDFGTSSFKPTAIETRKYLARALVKAFVPTEAPDTSISFTDLPSTNPFYPYAAITVKHGWLLTDTGGYFKPDASLLVRDMDRALTRALKLDTALQGLANVHQAAGTVYTLSTYFPFVQLAHALGLHYNHSTESMDIQQSSMIRRDEVAYSLWKAKTLTSSKRSSMSKFNNVSLPTLDPNVANQAAQQKLTQYALSQSGFPYIWGGEWNAQSPAGYCCGTQPQGGFDCSGFVWWVMKKAEDGYNSAQFRSYAGWSLHQRTSSTMAQYTSTKIGFSALQAGDLMFFSSNGGKTYADVNHVGIYLGNGWMANSASSVDGVALDWAGTATSNATSPTYWFNNFVWGRRLMGVVATIAASQPATASQLKAGDSR
jgi:cell wall-associated NlpC family hydrolase